MVRAAVIIAKGTAETAVEFTGESLAAILSVAAARHGEGNVRLKLPVDPERFFVGDQTREAV